MTENRKLRLVLTTYQLLTEKETPLKNFPCDFVRLQASRILKDSDNTPIDPDANGNYKTLENSVFWGCDKICVNELYVTEETEMIPVMNANEISIHSLAPVANQFVAISCFKYF